MNVFSSSLTGQHNRCAFGGAVLRCHGAHGSVRRQRLCGFRGVLFQEADAISPTGATQCQLCGGLGILVNASTGSITLRQRMSLPCESGTCSVMRVDTILRKRFLYVGGRPLGSAPGYPGGRQRAGLLCGAVGCGRGEFPDVHVAVREGVLPNEHLLQVLAVMMLPHRVRMSASAARVGTWCHECSPATLTDGNGPVKGVHAS